jgi:putative ABC transport system permease protein
MENLRSAPQPTFYTPIHQEEAGVRTSVTLVVRSASPLEAVVPPLRRAVWELDPTLALDAVDSVPALLARSMAPQRYRTFLLSLFAIIATVLSACGAFGVVARGLVHRTRDLGIRLALGARPSRLVAQEIGRESIAVAAGVLIGVTVAAGSAKVIGRFLFGVSAFDPVTYAAAAVGLGGLGLLAAWVATRRIIRLDPVRVLRAD